MNTLNLGADWRAGIEALSRARGAWIADDGVVARMVQCLPWVGGFWLKAGARGLLRLGFSDKPPVKGNDVGMSITHAVKSGEEAGKWLTLTHYPPPQISEGEVVSTTGAGDTLVGGIVAGLVSGAGEEEFIQAALEGVGRTLRSHLAVA